jgi:precorrin-6A/cobalt-precorrin-6A reductase
VIRERGSFDVAPDEALLRDHYIDMVVTKNAGGPDGKLVAARGASIAVIMVRRPPIDASARATTAAEALTWLHQNLR